METSIIPNFSVVTEFENKIAEFFGAPAAVGVDSCTSGIELCLRYTRAKQIRAPKHTYVSVPMLAEKLNISLVFSDHWWESFYYLTHYIIDAAVLWRANSYLPGRFMCLSFQYAKHLSLGKGGMILCPDEESANTLRRMAYDGRERGIPWREQDIDTMGYHYYMQPETAQLGLDKLDAAIATPPRQWVITDWPDVSKMKVFQNNQS